MELIDKIFSIFAPYECVGCGLEGPIICEACTASLLVTAFSGCIGCGKLTNNFSTCRSCKSNMSLENVWVAYAYNKTAKDIVNAYKYKSNLAVAGFMGDSMKSILPDINVLVTNAPSATSRVRSRGFDHASKLAKKVALNSSLPYQKLLYRTKSARQVGSTKKERIMQTKNLYYAISRKDVKGKNILIVEDVITTGATIASVASALKKAGAKNVFGLAFARKI